MTLASNGLETSVTYAVRVQDIEHPVAALTLDVGAHLRAVRTLYGLEPADVLAELARRAGTSGIDEKALRKAKERE